jgi:hypothetical protein
MAGAWAPAMGHGCTARSASSRQMGSRQSTHYVMC